MESLRSSHREQIYHETNASVIPLRRAALDHAGMLHPDDTRGRVSIAHATPHGWRERSYRVDQLPDVIAALAGEMDAYISQQRFECKRVIAQLWQLGAMYVDLDYHQIPQYAGMHPLGVLEDVLIALERAQKPAPTLAIFSGRGMYVIWLHSPVPRTALPRWNACQREIWQVLKPFGADRGALDAARVLRIAGTTNSKSGATVELIGPPGEVWNFEDLAAEILPVDRGTLHDIRIKRAARAAKSPSKRIWTPDQGFSQGTLWAGRLGDLQRLRGMRWLGDVPPGVRDTWMFLAGVAMSWIAIPPVLRRELWELAKEAASWSDEESARRLSAIMKRADMAARGELIEWQGRMVDPRYHYTNQRIIEELEITSDEERDMDVLISKSEKRRRDRERKEKQRRAAGIADRFAIAAQNRSEVARRTAIGESDAQMSEALKLSRRRIRQLRQEIEESSLDKPNTRRGEMNFPLYGGVAYPEGVSIGVGEPTGTRERTEIEEESNESPTAGLRSRTEPGEEKKNDIDITSAREHVPRLGEVIATEFRAAEDHALSCECETCSVRAPKYARCE